MQVDLEEQQRGLPRDVREMSENVRGKKTIGAT